jgi:hypothetical protein
MGCPDRRKPGAASWRSHRGSGLKLHIPLFRPGRGPGGPDVRGVGKPGAEIHQPLRVQPDLEPLQDAVEGAIVGPRTIPVVRALPWAVTLRKVSPRGTAAQDPQDRVEHLPRVAPLAAGGFRGREKIADELPLPTVEFVSSYHGSSVAAGSFLVVLRQSLVFEAFPDLVVLGALVEP